MNDYGPALREALDQQIETLIPITQFKGNWPWRVWCRFFRHRWHDNHQCLRCGATFKLVSVYELQRHINANMAKMMNELSGINDL